MLQGWFRILFFFQTATNVKTGTLVIKCLSQGIIICGTVHKSCSLKKWTAHFFGFQLDPDVIALLDPYLDRGAAQEVADDVGGPHG